MSNVSAAPLKAAQHSDGNWPTFRVQDTEQGGDTPDVRQPPDQELPDFDTELPDVVNDSGVPPFTGEDLEDTGKPRRRRRPQDEPNN